MDPNQRNQSLPPVNQAPAAPAAPQPPAATSDKPVSQQPSSQTPIYAGFWIRWAAYVIDFFVAVIPVLLISALVSLPIAMLTNTPLTEAFNKPPTTFVFDGVAAILFWFYMVYMTSKHGATLGKAALKLKVVTDDGSELTIGKAFMREVVGKIISGLIFSIGYLMAAFSSKKQALHDHVAGTEVILTKPATGITKLIVFLAVFAPIIPVIITFVMAGFLLATFGNKLKNAPFVVPSPIPSQSTNSPASPSANLNSQSPSNYQQTNPTHLQFDPIAGKYSIAIETVGCNSLSCIVATKNEVSGYTQVFSGADSIKPLTNYDVSVCTPNCGTGAILGEWNKRLCTSNDQGALTIDLQTNTCY